MSHDRLVRISLILIFLALVANVFRPQVQRFIAPPAAAQEKEAATAPGLRVTGDLVVDGNIIAKKDLRLDGALSAKGVVQSAGIETDAIQAKSAALADGLAVAKTITCRDITIANLLTAQNAQIAQALSAENVAVAKQVQVEGTAFIRNIAVGELKELNDALDASQSKIIDEIVARTVAVLRAIERP
ncbi:MAG: hypothetical protein GXP25_03215 [Planctomycetes bacterium]|nr:hypothetical protein [Planctomycetota bacterium]